ncbi:hypothetical protein EDD18DRAFT_192876 [Armillaria luteobubalina]|uniref:Thioester reductase (TE) domain-containing protein n=1 Tax=Armillaria luteobubalina TaxID=153913 RepID=A0AA39P248_9AGAR|nr:hypothetical protein EDD18DRAFT_192876 [Armillaria luteobubalina]
MTTQGSRRIFHVESSSLQHEKLGRGPRHRKICKTFAFNVALGLIFDEPIISGLVKAVEALRNTDLGLTYQEPITPPQNDFLGVPQKRMATTIEHGKDHDQLSRKLQESHAPLSSNFATKPITVFLIGATDFLGAFVLLNLLSRRERVKKVVCLVRASDCEKVLARLKEQSMDRGVWDDE